MLMIFSLSILSYSAAMARRQDSISVNQFVQEAANAGRKEVKMGEMGRQKAQNAGLREYAAMIIKDHTAANAELKTLAKSKNISLADSSSSVLPKTTDGTMRSDSNMRDSAVRNTSMHNTDNQHNMLMQTSGADFDTRYIEMMIDDHDKAIALFEKGAKVADPEIKAFAAKHLPTLRKHLNEAVRLSKSNGSQKSGKQQGSGQ